MKSLCEHSVEVRELLGGSTFLSPRGVLHLIHHPTTRTFTLLVFVVLVTTDLSNLFFYFSFWPVLLIWTGALALFFATLIAQFFCVAMIERRFRIALRPFRTTLFACAALTSSLFAELLGYGISGGANPVNFWPDLLIYVMLAEAFGQIYFRMVLPPIINSNQIAPGNASTVSPNDPPKIQPLTPSVQDHPEAPAPATATHEPLFDQTPSESMSSGPVNTPASRSETDKLARSILIGSEPIPLSKLRLIEAREHHVHVIMKDNSITHRARLSDIIAQTDMLDGIQPHRSWWVSARAAHSLSREGQRHVLHLDDGTRVPVARSRVDAVRQFLEDSKEIQ